MDAKLGKCAPAPTPTTTTTTTPTASAPVPRRAPRAASKQAAPRRWSSLVRNDSIGCHAERDPAASERRRAPLGSFAFVSVAEGPASCERSSAAAYLNSIDTWRRRAELRPARLSCSRHASEHESCALVADATPPPPPTGGVRRRFQPADRAPLDDANFSSPRAMPCERRPAAGATALDLCKLTAS
jgi:hypothetical protein